MGREYFWGKRLPLDGKSLSTFIGFASEWGYQELLLPAIEPAWIYSDKAGPEVLKQMYTFKDKADRDICLRPEGTATCQLLARGPLSRQNDVKLWYETRCWRYEKPQAGRYREFTQFGVEILNPKSDYRSELISMAYSMISTFASNAEIVESVKRGLAYYNEDGFEIIVPTLGAQKQVCGGGRYEEGIGFAIGVDRLCLAMTAK